MASTTTSRVLKSDAFGAIRLEESPGRESIVRDTAPAGRWVGALARWAARREARALRVLHGLGGVPRLLAFDGVRLERSYIAGRPMQEAKPKDLAYFRQARVLLRTIHQRGVAHNDLAKEPNWLVTTEGRPALVDFQIARIAHPRSRVLRLQAREDLRHLLKHKRTYCPEHLTPIERRLLTRRSWIRNLWFATGKPVYRWLTRRVLRWRDNEGQG
jgi:RIO-like serine/threonine protein kinase